MEERVRIARELHDTLLQGFQGLVLRFDAVMKTIPQDHPARNLMENVLDRADGLLLEGRERVRDLRHEEISANELQARLVTCGDQLRQNHAIRFSLSVIGTPQPLDPTVGDEVYRIGQEALTNAFQHSKSSKIEAEITYDHSRLRLRVRDDGAGIDQDVLLRGRDGHLPVPGVRDGRRRRGLRTSPRERAHEARPLHAFQGIGESHRPSADGPDVFADFVHLHRTAGRDNSGRRGRGQAAVSDNRDDRVFQRLRTSFFRAGDRTESAQIAAAIGKLDELGKGRYGLSRDRRGAEISFKC